MECAWGLVVMVRPDGGVACCRERDLGARLELLYAKSLYLVALNLAVSEQVWLLTNDHRKLPLLGGTL